MLRLAAGVLPDCAKNRQLAAEIERIQQTLLNTKFHGLDAHTIGRFAKYVGKILTSPDGVLLHNAPTSEPEGLASSMLLSAMRSGLHGALIEDPGVEGGRVFRAFDFEYPLGHHYRECALSNQARTYGGPLAAVWGDEAWGTEVLAVVAKGTVQHVQGVR